MSTRGSPGRPSTRSPRMFFMISEVPPSMELARERRNILRAEPGGPSSPMASADLNKDIYSKVVDLLGAEGMLYGSYEMVRPETAMSADTLQKAFLRSRANSIEGGTTEVMKNILGERVLGLPGDIRVDKDKPWSEIPRS